MLVCTLSMKRRAGSEDDDVQMEDSDPVLRMNTTMIRNGAPQKRRQYLTSDRYVKSVSRNGAKPRDPTRKIPQPIVIDLTINGKVVRALIDTGSLSDFISNTVADQLKLNRVRLQTPITCQLAASGSRTQIQYYTYVEVEYQNVRETRRFDIMNIDGFDCVLGTPFLFQHGIVMGFNPYRVLVTHEKSVPIKGPDVRTLSSISAYDMPIHWKNFDRTSTAKLRICLSPRKNGHYRR